LAETFTRTALVAKNVQHSKDEITYELKAATDEELGKNKFNEHAR
jgi:hypothetical protein